MGCAIKTWNMTSQLYKSKMRTNKDEYTYVLGLEGGNFYVGTTTNLKNRLSEHIRWPAQAWVKLNFVTSVVEVRRGGIKEERRTTIEYMNKYGRQRVRGAGWCHVRLIENNYHTIGIYPEVKDPPIRVYVDPPSFFDPPPRLKAPPILSYLLRSISHRSASTPGRWKSQRTRKLRRRRLHARLRRPSPRHPLGDPSQK
jgi:predicted GIY-YIG superfamily endonuclease